MALGQSRGGKRGKGNRQASTCPFNCTVTLRLPELEKGRVTFFLWGGVLLYLEEFVLVASLLGSGPLSWLQRALILFVAAEDTRGSDFLSVSQALVPNGHIP